MEIKSNNVTFGAKFLHSNDLKQVADYAVEHGKFDKLNQARKNIESAYLTTRIRLEISESKSGKPVLNFTKFMPKKSVGVAYSFDDYHEVKTVSYKSEKKVNPLKFALEKIIKMGNSVPDNKIFRNVVK